MSRAQDTNKGDSRRVNKVDRIPVSGGRKKLTIEGKDPNYHYCVITDREGNIDKFIRGGYEVCKRSELDSIGLRTVNKTDSVDDVARIPVGLGDDGIVMKIKREWYEEDQAAKQVRNKEQTESMFQNLNSGKDGTYGKVEVK